jgi:hypothetical protein
MRSSVLRTLFSVFALCAPSIVAAQRGAVVTAHVIDARDGSGVPEVEVRILGTALQARTDSLGLARLLVSRLVTCPSKHAVWDSAPRCRE